MTEAVTTEAVIPDAATDIAKDLLRQLDARRRSALASNLLSFADLKYIAVVHMKLANQVFEKLKTRKQGRADLLSYRLVTEAHGRVGIPSVDRPMVDIVTLVTIVHHGKSSSVTAEAFRLQARPDAFTADIVMKVIPPRGKPKVVWSRNFDE